jgi:hypothetical protein
MKTIHNMTTDTFLETNFTGFNSVPFWDTLSRFGHADGGLDEISEQEIAGYFSGKQ